ncbi:MAG: transglycosylase domain-containing protein, partial [Proteobacteria bacterium]|nr:transglycosylase domain-containing protein [Pseudomonadota bacterium]
MTPKVKKRKRKILTWLGAAFVIVCVVLPIVLNALFPLPMKQRSIARVVLAEDGTPMWRFADENGVWRFHIKKDEVSPLYIDALLTYEDRWFYHHPGINPAAMLRALTQNITNGRIISGGSTITMQVARLIDPHPRTIPGKLRQVWRTLQLEWYFTKDEILELYINDAPFGGTLEGVAAASWAYLGKSPSQFTHAEAALMAVLPQAPSRLRPDRHPKRAEIARNKVLSSLERHNVWPEEHIREAMEENIWLNPRVEPKMAPLLARRLA